MNAIDRSLELLTLKQVFDDGRRSFAIPDFQRGYSWEEDQRADLLRDIEYGMSGDYNHYGGTLVAVKNHSIQDFDHYEIVDGQQRLTSLIILLSCIAHTNGRIDFATKEDLRRCFIEEGSDLGSTRRKFQLSDEQDSLFWQMVNEPDSLVTIKNKGHQNIVEAFGQFKNWIQEPKNETSIYEVYKYVTNCLGFILYAPEDTKEIGIMFEVINNRGKPLSELEKVKNYLMYFSEKNEIRDLKTAVNDKWPRILEHLNSCNHTSNDAENGFLRNCWIVFWDTNKSKSQHVYDNLKAQFPTTDETNWKPLYRFVAFLEESARSYRMLYTRENVTNIEELECLRRLGNQPVLASVLPLILAIFSRETDEQTRVALLKLVEKLNFRFYGTGIASRSDSGQGELFRLAHDYYADRMEDGRSFDAFSLESMLREFVNRNANDIKLVKNLTLDKDESGNYYSWSWLKYFLASYEGTLKKNKQRDEKLEELLARQDAQNPNDFYQIEHIWAVKDYEKFDDSENPDINKRRLGNFILLRALPNKRISNNPPEVKVESYLTNYSDVPETLMIRELKGLFDKAQEEIERNRTNKTWKYWYEVYSRFLDLHEEKYVNFALERWQVDGISHPVKGVALNSLSGRNEIYELTD
ncbi:MAG: DUF262 domain-containing protein [Gemmatimonadota bacterium]|nr:DUF262 domain-containing protein [Gemmatimonadota bacterium]